ncbi:nuclear transport factor 2 family protein [Kribbella swartbergensis]
MTRTKEHVDAFNEAVTTGDWDAFAQRFAEDAQLIFIGIPVGPFEGRPAIAAAYRADPPDETMTLVSTEPSGPATDIVRFRWAGGGTGTMHLTWAPDGAVRTLTVSFD